MKKHDKTKNEEELDTQTTFADMNVEGFSWYDPQKKQGKQKVSVDKSEFWEMVKGAFLAYLPMIGVIAFVSIVIFLLAYVWLK